MKNLEVHKCNLCPHSCGADRQAGKYGVCGCNDKIKVALASLHKFEEPCISGSNGSGTIFFSNCTMKCIFCQNYKISQLGGGNYITTEELADLFLKQQNSGAHNINLVTPTMYVIQIIKAIDIARERGLNIPIIYNSSGYETIDTIRMLNGYIDVYLPDFKYFSDELSKALSGVNRYKENATKAILEMYRQVGNAEFDDNGIIQKGIIIRHLILPGYVQNTKNILKWIKENLPNDTYISIMSQYFPTYKAIGHSKLGRKVNRREYREIESYIYQLGFENGYIQDYCEGDDELKYVPEFL